MLSRCIVRGRSGQCVECFEVTLKGGLLYRLALGNIVMYICPDCVKKLKTEAKNLLVEDDEA